MKRGLQCLLILAIFIFGCKMSSSEPDRRQVADASNANVTVPDRPAGNPFPSPSQATTPKPTAANAVCPSPDKPCHHKDKHFDDWEISFRMPARLQPNKTYNSAPFYAVLLKTYESDDDCDGGEYVESIEAERKREQARQIGRKVFALYGCPNMGAVGYDFDGMWDAKHENALISNFLAVYAGESKPEAEETLKDLKTEYPQAVLKQMTANFEIIDQ